MRNINWIYFYILVALLPSCRNKEVNIDHCKSIYLGSWSASERFVFMSYDTIQSDISRLLDIKFNYNQVGWTLRKDNHEKFTWTCTDSVLNIEKELNASAYLDYGIFDLLYNSSDSLVLQRYLEFSGYNINGDSVNTKSWLTWILVKE